MSRYTLAVLSDSPDYIDHFLMFINNSQVLQADAIGFTDMNALMDYLASGMIDILLLHGGTPLADEYLSSDYYYMEGVGTDERNRNTDTNANINILAVLSEHQDMCSVPVHINMYRPMKLIEKDLASLIAALDLEDPSLFRNLDITGIYTRGTGADPYSIAMDIISAAEYPYNTLYLDLDTFSGLDIILDAGSAMTLSDLIYYYLTAPEMLHTQAKAGVIHAERACFILPPSHPQDTDQLKAADWCDFLRDLALLSGCRRIIINMPASGRDLVCLFGLCQSVYVSWNEYFAASDSPQVTAFKRYFISRSREDILSRICNAADISEVSPCL